MAKIVQQAERKSSCSWGYNPSRKACGEYTMNGTLNVESRIQELTSVESTAGLGRPATSV